jgi:hypothetical protein
LTFGLAGLDRFGPNGRAIRDILESKNGFFCFESALRFFPSATVEPSWGLHQWNSHGLWKSGYYGLADSLFCFAEDIFGRQFCLATEEIRIFDPETGDLETIALTLDELASRLLENHDAMVGYQFAKNWQKAHGGLSARDRLMPKKPFVLGGKYELANLVALDSLRVMKSLGNLARQIHDLPDGSQIEFKIL